MQQLQIFSNEAQAGLALAGVKAELGYEFDYYSIATLGELMEQNRKALPEGSRLALGLNAEVDNITISDYTLFVLAATCGCDLLPGKVAVVGDGDQVDKYWPEQLLQGLACFSLEELSKTGLKGVDAVIVCDDINEEEVLELGFKGLILTPQSWVNNLLQRMQPTMGSLKAMLILLGAIKVSETDYVLRRGSDTARIKVEDESIQLSVNHREMSFKKGFFCGGALEGIDGKAPVKTLFATLWFALKDESGNAMTGKLAGLTELYADPGYGEVREGVAELKYEYRLGFLKARANRELQVPMDIGFVNGGRADIKAAAKLLDAANIEYLPGHQADSLTYGPGALALGLAFDADGETVHGNIPHHRKKEKILNSFALDKATCDYTLLIEQ